MTSRGDNTAKLTKLWLAMPQANPPLPDSMDYVILLLKEDYGRDDPAAKAEYEKFEIWTTEDPTAAGSRFLAIVSVLSVITYPRRTRTERWLHAVVKSHWVKASVMNEQIKLSYRGKADDDPTAWDVEWCISECQNIYVCFRSDQAEADKLAPKKAKALVTAAGPIGESTTGSGAADLARLASQVDRLTNSVAALAINGSGSGGGNRQAGNQQQQQAPPAGRKAERLRWPKEAPGPATGSKGPCTNPTCVNNGRAKFHSLDFCSENAKAGNPTALQGHPGSINMDHAWAELIRRFPQFANLQTAPKTDKPQQQGYAKAKDNNRGKGKVNAYAANVAPQPAAPVPQAAPAAPPPAYQSSYGYGVPYPYLAPPPYGLQQSLQPYGPPPPPPSYGQHAAAFASAASYRGTPAPSQVSAPQHGWPMGYGAPPYGHPPSSYAPSTSSALATDTLSVAQQPFGTFITRVDGVAAVLATSSCTPVSKLGGGMASLSNGHTSVETVGPAQTKWPLSPVALSTTKEPLPAGFRQGPPGPLPSAQLRVPPSEYLSLLVYKDGSFHIRVSEAVGGDMGMVMSMLGDIVSKLPLPAKQAALSGIPAAFAAQATPAPEGPAEPLPSVEATIKRHLESKDCASLHYVDNSKPEQGVGLHTAEGKLIFPSGIAPDCACNPWGLIVESLVKELGLVIRPCNAGVRSLEQRSRPLGIVAIRTTINPGTPQATTYEGEFLVVRDAAAEGLFRVLWGVHFFWLHGLVLDYYPMPHLKFRPGFHRGDDKLGGYVKLVPAPAELGQTAAALRACYASVSFPSSAAPRAVSSSEAPSKDTQTDRPIKTKTVKISCDEPNVPFFLEALKKKPLLSGHHDSTVRIWDLGTGKAVSDAAFIIHAAADLGEDELEALMDEQAQDGEHDYLRDEHGRIFGDLEPLPIEDFEYIELSPRATPGAPSPPQLPSPSPVPEPEPSRSASPPPPPVSPAPEREAPSAPASLSAPQAAPVRAQPEPAASMQVTAVPSAVTQFPPSAKAPAPGHVSRAAPSEARTMRRPLVWAPPPLAAPEESPPVQQLGPRDQRQDRSRWEERRTTDRPRSRSPSRGAKEPDEDRGRDRSKDHDRDRSRDRGTGGAGSGPSNSTPKPLHSKELPSRLSGSRCPCTFCFLIMELSRLHPDNAILLRYPGEDSKTRRVLYPHRKNHSLDKCKIFALLGGPTLLAMTSDVAHHFEIDGYTQPISESELLEWDLDEEHLSVDQSLSRDRQRLIDTCRWRDGVREQVQGALGRSPYHAPQPDAHVVLWTHYPIWCRALARALSAVHLRLDWGLYRADNAGPLATNAEEARGARRADQAAQALAEGLRLLQQGAGGAEAPPAAPPAPYLPPGLRLEDLAAAVTPAPPPRLMTPIHIVTPPAPPVVHPQLPSASMQPGPAPGMQLVSASPTGYPATVLATVASPMAQQLAAALLSVPLPAVPPPPPGGPPEEEGPCMRHLSQRLPSGDARWSQPGATRNACAEVPQHNSPPPICVYMHPTSLPLAIPSNNSGTGLLLGDNEYYRWASGGWGKFQISSCHRTVAPAAFSSDDGLSGIPLVLRIDVVQTLPPAVEGEGLLKHEPRPIYGAYGGKVIYWYEYTLLGAHLLINGQVTNNRDGANDPAAVALVLPPTPVLGMDDLPYGMLLGRDFNAQFNGVRSYGEWSDMLRLSKRLPNDDFWTTTIQLSNAYNPGDIRFCALTPSPGRGGEEERNNNQPGPAEHPDTDTASAEEEGWEPVPGHPGQLRPRPPPSGSRSASPLAENAAAAGPYAPPGQMRDAISRWADAGAAHRDRKARATTSAARHEEQEVQDAKCQELLEAGVVTSQPRQRHGGAGPSAAPMVPPTSTAAPPPPAPPLVLPPAPEPEPERVPPPCRPKRSASAPRRPLEPLGKLSRNEEDGFVLSLGKEEVARLRGPLLQSLLRRLDSTFASFEDQELAAGRSTPRETVQISSDEAEVEDKADPPDTTAPCSGPRPQRRDDDDADAGGAGDGAASAPTGTVAQPPASAPTAPPAPASSTQPAGTAVHSLSPQDKMELPVTPCPAFSANPGPRLYLPDGTFLTPDGDGGPSLCPHHCNKHLETTTFFYPFSQTQKDGDGTGPVPCRA